MKFHFFHTISKKDGMYIIVEMLGNHNVDFGYAVNILEVVKEDGVEDIKLQIYTVNMITLARVTI